MEFNKNLAKIIDNKYSRHKLIKLLECINKGLPEDLYSKELTIGYNEYNGHVFLYNCDYQAVTINDNDSLAIFHYLPYSGEEGFLEDLIEDADDDTDEEDLDYLLAYATKDSDKEKLELLKLHKLIKG